MSKKGRWYYKDAPGRKRKYANLERTVLDALEESESGIGFRKIHSEYTPECSKSTLSLTLKLLLSKRAIKKTKNGKYTINQNSDYLTNTRQLKFLLNNLNRFIPNLNNLEKAYIGIKLWTIIFQREFHPARMFEEGYFLHLSYEASKARHQRIVKEFFESRNEMSLFEEEMYNLLIDFCHKLPSKVLEEVFYEVIHSDSSKFISKDPKYISIVKSFREEIFIRRQDIATFYGIPFCNILSQKKPKEFNKENMEKLKIELSRFQEKFL